MSDYIPGEVLIEILLRVPVKSLLRFRCVCKSWYSLISGQNFISMHTKRTISKNKIASPNYLLLRHYSEVNKKESFTLHSDDDGLISEQHELDFPFLSNFGYFEIIGSCNGILCLADNGSQLLKRMVLWNRSIGLSVTLPLQFVSHRDVNVIIGFGFDSWTSDYKVVRILYPSIIAGLFTIPPDVEIFELSKGAWRTNSRKNAPAYLISRFSSQVFLNGAIHWIGFYSPSNSIVAVLDMHDEVFKEFKIPRKLASVMVQHLSIMLCGELLCVIEYKKWRGHLCYESCSIWAMNEYGIADSWSILFNVDGAKGVAKTLGLRRNYEVLLVRSGGELVSNDPWSKEITSLGIYGEASSFHVCIYMESLVLLKANKAFTRPTGSRNAISYGKSSI